MGPPVVPGTEKAEAGASLEPRSWSLGVQDQPGQYDKTMSLKNKTKQFHINKPNS